MQNFEKLLLTQDLPALFKELWSELAVAAQNRKHPWHLFNIWQGEWLAP